MAAGDVKTIYVASADQTVTALNSLGTSSDWTAGWTSAYIDNTTNGYDDYIISGKVTMSATPPTAGQIRISLYAEMDDSNPVDIFSSGTEGTVGAATILDTTTRDNSLVLVKSITNDTTASQVYPWSGISAKAAFGNTLPRKFAIFIAQSTAQSLAASGNQVTTKGVYYNIAQA